MLKPDLAQVKKSTGPQSAKSVEQIFNVLKEYKVFEKNGKLFPKSNVIWKNSSNKLDRSLSPATLYLYVSSNYKELKDKLNSYYAQQDKSFVEKKTNSLEYVISKCDLLSFSIEFDDEEWNFIKPYQNDEGQKVLPEAWTHRILDKVYQKVPLQCPYAFKKGTVYKDGSIKCDAYCRECNNFLNAEYSLESKKKEFIITTHDSSKVKHFKKRPLSKFLRKEAQKELIHVKPLKFKRQEAKKEMEFGEADGPLVHSSPVLRQARTSGIFRKYNLKPSQNVMDQIAAMGSDGNFFGIIKDFNEYPFSVMFWTNEQIEVWKYFCANYDKDITVSLDASGRFVRKIKISPTETTNHIFLYVLCVSIEGKIYPLMQFLSDCHSANYLKFNLDLWKKAGVPRIKEIVTDGSKALQNMISLCYNDCTFKIYLEWCHKVVQNSEQIIPPCYIREDIAHLIKAMTRWGFWPKYASKVKDFYIRIFGYMSTLSNFHDFRKVCEKMLLVCQSTGVTENSEVEFAIIFLYNCIKTYNVAYCPEDCTCDSCTDPVIEEYDDEKRTREEEDVQPIEKLKGKPQPGSVKYEIDRMNLNALENVCKNDKNNDFFCPDLPKIAISYFCEYPTWTNILMKAFNSTIEVSTSGRSEALFSDLRHVTGIKRPVTCSLFLSIYVEDYLKGAMNLAMGYMQKEKFISPISLKNLRDDLSQPKSKRGKFVEHCPDVEARHKKPGLKPSQLLKNANILLPMKTGNVVHTFQSSCMYDSIFELCASAYTNYAKFNETLNHTCHEKPCFSAAVIKYLNDKECDLKEIYTKRLQLCLLYYDNINGKLVYSFPFGNFVQQLFQQCSENTFYIKVKKSISEEILDITRIEAYLIDILVKSREKVSNYIFVDIDEFNDTTKVDLQGIPVCITLNKDSFTLAGVIAFEHSAYKKNFRHYFTYCRSIKDFWCLKDDQLFKHINVKVASIKNINVAVLFYVKCN